MSFAVILKPREVDDLLIFLYTRDLVGAASAGLTQP
jgi:hypothetical protein